MVPGPLQKESELEMEILKSMSKPAKDELLKKRTEMLALSKLAYEQDDIKYAPAYYDGWVDALNWILNEAWKP